MGMAGRVIRFKNERDGAIYKMVRTGLLQAITEHGVIHRGLIRSASKRIYGNIKNVLHNQQLEKIRKVREMPFTNA